MTNKERGSAGTVAVIVLAVLLVIVVPIAFFAAKTVLAPTIGKAKAYQAKNSALNRVQAQERFEEMYQDVLASDRRLDPLAAAKDESLTAKQTYLGAVSYCISAVGEYNAEARKYSAAEFRAIDLPPQIDPYTPETDCKESS